MFPITHLKEKQLKGYQTIGDNRFTQKKILDFGLLFFLQNGMGENKIDSISWSVEVDEKAAKTGRIAT